MTAATRAIHAGQRPFTRTTLAVYDPLVLELTCHWIWRCPTARILAHYRRHLSANHLEVGVGTGFFIDRSVFPVELPRLGLLDLNANCLARTAARVARYAPEVYTGNVLERIDLEAPRFDSLALNYVLHCLPGALPQKSVVFEHLARLLNPGGVIFGATVLSAGVPVSAAARSLMAVCNATGVFSNANDDLSALEAALCRHLREVRIVSCGCVALFCGRT
jgi:ubiquinone/menaquinone biosynthesis C-methylase UbiE